MTARERILMIRLMEKLKKYPTYAKALAIEAAGAAKIQKNSIDPEGLADV